jgi:hypothetical protein
LPLDALIMAPAQRQPTRDQLIHHPNHGGEYFSVAHTREVELAGVEVYRQRWEQLRQRSRRR